MTSKLGPGDMYDQETRGANRIIRLEDQRYLSFSKKEKKLRSKNNTIFFYSISMNSKLRPGGFALVASNLELKSKGYEGKQGTAVVVAEEEAPKAFALFPSYWPPCLTPYCYCHPVSQCAPLSCFLLVSFSTEEQCAYCTLSLPP